MVESSAVRAVRPRPAIALSIAGSDPSGGAGIQADLKTFHQHRVYGCAVPTLLTTLPDIEEQIARLEVHYLANPEAELRFALLSDWRDAPEETMPETHPLYSLPNVVITPHVGWVSEDSYVGYFEGIVENVEAYIDGRPIPRMLNPEALEHRRPG